jgi:SNF2-related domain
MQVFGEITYLPRSKSWKIVCQPHVSLKLKRLFTNINADVVGESRLTATPANSRDLEWFTLRFPMTVTPPGKLTEIADKYREQQTTLENLLSGAYTGTNNFTLKKPARDYQTVAANTWLTVGGLLLGDAVGLGKAQPLDAKVLTPSGWKLMGELKIGDEVVDPDGGTGFVEGIFPQGEKDIYRLTAKDNSSTECCDDHLWTIQTIEDRISGKFRTLTTNYMREKGVFEPNGKHRRNKFFLPRIQPTEFSPRPNPIIPAYTMGALLGDGGFRSSKVGLTAKEIEIVDRVRSELPPNLTLKHLGEKENPYDYSLRVNWEQLNTTRIRKEKRCRSDEPDTINQYGEELVRLELAGKYSYEKHIPEEYLYASVADRIELLRGIMDTDGECNSQYGAYFSSSSEQFAKDVADLVRSLGGQASFREGSVGKYRLPSGEKKTCRPSWNVSVKMDFPPFHLKRKIAIWKTPMFARAIVGIESVGKKEAQCIRVSTRRHLYLTDDYIPTHNTVSALTGLTDERTLPALIVVQSHLPDQWIEKIQEFTHLTTHKVLKGTPYDVTKYTGGVFPDVLVLNYHKLSGWAETIAGMMKSVVYDEVQELRHTGTAKYSAAELLAKKVPYRLGLSATPIFNYGGEIWNVMNILTPDQLGSFPEFRREWSNQNSDDAKLRIKDPKVFGFYLRQEGFMLRRTRKEVRRELPAVTVVPHKVAADLSVLNVIKGDAIRLAQLILQQKQDFQGQKMQAAGEFDLKMRLSTGIAKAPHVAEFVKMLCLDNDIKVILFAWHRECYDIYMEALAELNPVMYTGSENPAQKQAAKQRFIHGDSRLMLMSLRSGAGTDGLQDVCSTVVFGEYDYSPAVHKQCIGRVNRDRSDGSPCDPVVAYYATSDHGSDPTMMRILGLKNEQAAGVVDPDSDLSEDIQVDPESVKRLAREFLERQGIPVEADLDSNNVAEV